MTDTDLLIISLGINIAFIYYYHRLVNKYNELGEIFSKTLFIINGVTDKMLKLQRDTKGQIHVKVNKDETDRHSVQTDQDVKADPANPAGQ